MFYYKIIIGCTILFLMLSIAILSVYQEYLYIEDLNKMEVYSYRKKEAVDIVLQQLLDFSFSENLLLEGDSAEYNSHKRKYITTIEALNKLKLYYVSDVQHLQINKIILLLSEKERLLQDAMILFSKFPRADSLLYQQIPFIVPNISTRMELKEMEKKNILRKLFGKKKDKSIYSSRKQLEQSDASQYIKVKLHSLQKEIYEQYVNYRERLSVYSDSLQQRKKEMNLQIGNLMDELEKTIKAQSAKEINEMIASRKRSFFLILFITFFSILLLIALYVLVYCHFRKMNKYQVQLQISDCKNRELLTIRKKMMLAVGHDLRAPLGTICEFAELMQKEKDGEQNRKYAINIQHASRYVIGLANNLLYYYKLETEKEQTEKEIFHLGQTLENGVSSFFPAAEKKGLGLTMEIKDCNILVIGDSGRLMQILCNLLSNAVKFTHTGYIHVGSRYNDRKLSLFVRDTGIGIDKEKQECIFSDFEQGGLSMNGDGFGLGLAITSRLVALMNGDIYVDSLPEQGSTFKVCLPFEETENMQENRSNENMVSGIKILFIDDDRMQLEVPRKMYARSGIECDCCQSSGELVALLRKGWYDLVLTDMQMCDMDGYGILSLLRGCNVGQSRTVPVLAVTARFDENEEYFKKMGFVGCLNKPFSEKELLNATYSIERPDFTAILEGEKNVEELLAVFIEDTRKELAGMQDAFTTRDYKRVERIIHKAVPLWIMIRIDIPLQELENMASLPVESWHEVSEGQFERLSGAVRKAIEKAEILKEEINGSYTDSGR